MLGYIKGKKFIKRASVLAGLLAGLLLLCSCAAGSGSDFVVGAGSEFSGGDSSLGGGVNLKDIGIEVQGQDTVCEPSFISGSRLANVDEAKISSVPAYELSVIEAPSRLKITWI
jgi:hypothetical protein